MHLVDGGGDAQAGGLPVLLVDHGTHARLGRFRVDGGKGHDAALLGDDVVVDARVLEQVIVVGRILLQIGRHVQIHVLLYGHIVAAGIGATLPGDQGLEEDVGQVSGGDHQIELLRCGGLIRLGPLEAVAQIFLQPAPEHGFLVAFGGMGPGPDRIEDAQGHGRVVEGQYIVRGHFRLGLRLGFLLRLLSGCFRRFLRRCGGFFLNLRFLRRRSHGLLRRFHGGRSRRTACRLAGAAGRHQAQQHGQGQQNR